MDYQYLKNRPLPLEDMRVQRSYIGGSLLNKWKGLPDCGESDLCEEWQMSVIEVQYPGSKPGEGLSKVKLEDGSEAYLQDIISADPEGFLGAAYVRAHGNTAGLGVRTGDSVVRLSLQAHPRAEDARRFLHFPRGKTEAWYIVETREIDGQRPYVRIGWKKGITKEKVREMFYAEDVSGIENAMHQIFIKKGDVILVPAGTPHAMGPGAMFLEVAEACDFTFKLEHVMPARRLDDREMHYGIGFDNMLECFDYTTYEEDEIRARTIFSGELVEETPAGKVYKLFGYEANPTFTMYRYDVSDGYVFQPADHYRVAVPIYGSGTAVSEDGASCPMRQGSGIFLPASMGPVTLHGNFSFICSDCAKFD